MWRATKAIGGGGFGIVYRARRNGDDQVYALKRIARKWAREPEVVRRFKREIEIQADLDHPNVVPVVDYELEKEPPFFVMPLADSSLADALKDLDQDDALALFAEILDAIEYCHSRGVVHRDLKPKNILLFDGTPKVSDFGLGKHTDRTSSLKTRTAVWAGTRPYAAPEQMEELREADARADIHALGKILQELLTGELPSNLDQRVPSSFRYVIATATARDPERRFQTVEEFRDALAAVETSTDRILPREDEAEQLVKAVAAAKPRTVADRVLAFQQFVAGHSSDDQLIRAWVPKLDLEALKAFARSYPDEFEQLIRLYEESLPRQMAFDYCDTVANFGARVYVASQEFAVRELVLRMLLTVGESHDRYYVAEVAMRILCRIDDPAEIQMALRVLESREADARWMMMRAERILAERGAARSIVHRLERLASG